jgi:hypothetical protein
MNSESLDILSAREKKSIERAHLNVQETQLTEQAVRESHQECLNECCLVNWKPVRSYERRRKSR